MKTTLIRSLVLVLAAAAIAPVIHRSTAVASQPQFNRLQTTPLHSWTTPAIATPNSFAPAAIAQATVLARGQFVTVEQNHPTLGTAEIVQTGDQRTLTFSADFETADGPAVEVVLYRGDQAPVNLAEGSYYSLAVLQSFDGGQTYNIPAEVNVAEYGAIAIWCREFNVTFGYADI